jgi:hypothetical protein
MKDPKSRLKGVTTNDDLSDTIKGILVGFANKLNERDGWMDILTTMEAEDEIKRLIASEVFKVRSTLIEKIKNCISES